MDFVLYWIDEGEFEFEKHNYPYVYHIDSVAESLHHRKAERKNRDVTETWVPTNQLPNDKQKTLDKIIKKVRNDNI